MMSRTGTSMLAIIFNCTVAGICAGIFFAIILSAMVLFLAGSDTPVATGYPQSGAELIPGSHPGGENLNGSISSH